MKKKTWFSKKSIDLTSQKGSNLKLQTELRKEYKTICTTVGIADNWSRGRSSYDLVIVILDLIKNNNGTLQQNYYVIRDIWRAKLTPTENLRMIEDIVKKIEPNGIRFRSEQLLHETIADLKEINSESISYMKFHYHQTGGKLKPIGVQTISGLLKKKLLVLPSDYEDKRTYDLMKKLLEEMERYPHHPLGESLEALTYAYFEIQYYLHNKLTIPSIPYIYQPKSLLMNEEVDIIKEIKEKSLKTLGRQITTEEAQILLPKYLKEKEWGKKCKEAEMITLEKAKETQKRIKKDTENEELNTFNRMMRKRY